MTRTRVIFIFMTSIFLLCSAAMGHDGFFGRDNSSGRMSGGLATADACGARTGYLGGFVGLGDNSTSVFGSYTYGLSKYTEGRLKLGLSDPEENPDQNHNIGILFGADLKYEFMDHQNPSTKAPFDMAAGGSLEFARVNGGSVFELGGNLIGSIPYRFHSGNKIVPYMIINVRLERFSSSHSSSHSSDLEGGMNLGAKFEFSDDLNLYGEFQLDGTMFFFTGIEFRAF